MSKKMRVTLLGVIVVAGFSMTTVDAMAGSSSEEFYHWSSADLDADFSSTTNPGNYVIDLNDLMILANDWLDIGDVSIKYIPGTDINRDGIVNFLDFAIFANEYGKDVRYNGNGKMVASVVNNWSEEGDEFHPYINSEVTIFNMTSGFKYQINKVDFACPVYNEPNAVTIMGDDNLPAGWTDDLSDPNQIKTSTISNVIVPGEIDNTFTIWLADLSQTIDPNFLQYDMKEVSAIKDDNVTLWSTFDDVKVPLPIKKSNN